MHSLGDLRIIKVLDNLSWVQDDYEVERYGGRNGWEVITKKPVSIEVARDIVKNGGTRKVVT